LYLIKYLVTDLDSNITAMLHIWT